MWLIEDEFEFEDDHSAQENDIEAQFEAAQSPSFFFETPGSACAEKAG
jgi:hypothetical protein